MRAYSLDRRKRVIGAYRASEGSIHELAEQFQVAKNTVENGLRRQRESGIVAPQPQVRGVPAVRSGDRLDMLCRLVGGRDDATFEEQREAGEREVHTSREAVDRAL